MSWLGIPFKLLSDNSDAVNLSVTSIPNLVLKSDPDYTTAFLTAGVSLVAGLIPAGIAFYTFFKNSQNLTRERKEQQDFLKREREEQQKFLKEERAAQAASLEADRLNQKNIAERNFNMQVLSANRQAWINKLRELLADYISLSTEFLAAHTNFIVAQEYFNNVSDKRNYYLEKEIVNDTVEKTYEDATNKLSNEISKIYSCMAREKFITSNIRLMLNPQEKFYGIIDGIFDEITSIYTSIQKDNGEDNQTKIVSLHNEIDKLISASHEMLKFEWERVKKAE